MTMPPLNELMEFDRVLQVTPKGILIYRPDVNIYADLNVTKDGTDEFELSEGWTLLTGFTGQHGYNGPVMHPSEFVGGGLERHIRETPGYYVVLIVEGRCDYDGSTECDPEVGCSCEPAGWAIAYREEL